MSCTESERNELLKTFGQDCYTVIYVSHPDAGYIINQLLRKSIGFETHVFPGTMAIAVDEWSFVTDFDGGLVALASFLFADYEVIKTRA